MDENKLNELFRELLENRLKAAPPSSYSSSEITTLESSINAEAQITYDDIVKKLQGVLNHTIELENLTKEIIVLNNLK